MLLGNLVVLTRLGGVDQSGREHIDRDAIRRQLEREYTTEGNDCGFARRIVSLPHGRFEKRVGIARALANQPSALLMDEPFGALDALTRDTMRKELLRIWLQLQPTVVFVTHSVPEAVYLADQIAVMKLGEGTIHRQIAIDLPRPRDTRAQAFLDYVDAVEGLLNNEVEVAVTRE